MPATHEAVSGWIQAEAIGTIAAAAAASLATGVALWTTSRESGRRRREERRAFELSALLSIAESRADARSNTNGPRETRGRDKARVLVGALPLDTLPIMRAILGHLPRRDEVLRIARERCAAADVSFPPPGDWYHDLVTVELIDAIDDRAPR